MQTDSVSNMIANIKGAALSGAVLASVPNTKLVRASLVRLISLGFINSFKVVNSKRVIVFLKYSEHNCCAIQNFRRVSTPGARVYFSIATLQHFSRSNNLTNTLQFVILTTTQGLLTHREAIIKKMGGEVLFIIG